MASTSLEARSFLDTRAAKRGLEAWEKAAKARLMRKLDVAGSRKFSFGIVFHQARPIQAIRRVIRSVKPELLIVGTKDRSIFKRVLSGSVANDVLRRARCDILVAAPSAAIQDSPPRSEDIGARN